MLWDVNSCQSAYQKPNNKVQSVIPDPYTFLYTAKRRLTNLKIPLKPNANFVGCRIVRSKRNKETNRCHSKKCFDCEAGLLANYSRTTRKVSSIPQKESVRQFMVFHYNDHTIKKDDEKTADDLDDIFPHIIEIDN